MKAIQSFSPKIKSYIKNPQSRSGGMLILVLVVFAVAIILTTSAMTITLATRQHYYKEAEEQQVELTAMSAAKMIADAVSNKSITAAQLESFAAPAGGTTFNISSDSQIPGLLGSVGSDLSSATAIFEKRTIGSKDYIAVTVKTNLDAGIAGTNESEGEVTVLLERHEGIASKPFANLVTMGTEDTINDLRNYLNKLAMGDTTSGGFIVVHGDVHFKDNAGGPPGKPNIYSDIVFTGNAVNGGANFHGSIILYGAATFAPDDSSAIRISENGVVTYPVGYADVPLTDAEVTDIMGSSGRKVLTTEQGLVFFSRVSNTTYTFDSTGATKLTAADLAGALTITAKAVNGDITRGSDTYYIDLNGSSVNINNTITFDLSQGRITLYIIDSASATAPIEVDHSLQINNSGKIEFTNGTVSSIGKICLIDGADIYFPQNSSGKIIGRLATGEPCVYIYGLGELGYNNPNVIYLVDGTLDAYIGLYGSDGNFILGRGNKYNFLGRYEGAYMDRSGQGSNGSPFSYCPPPPAGSDSTGTTYGLPFYMIAGYIS